MDHRWFRAATDLVPPRGSQTLCLRGPLGSREPESGTALETFTILTTRPNNLVHFFHHRMPVIIAPEDYDRWLDTEVPPPTELLAPTPAGRS